jgi:hypothetical protein
MPDKWEELLPFYAAGTLEPAQKTALEKHLDGCENCRRSLSEWHVIGDAVRAEAESWARTLPLPRYNGQFGEMPTGRRQVTRRRPRRGLALATMAASLVAVLLLGGLIAYMATRIRPNDPSARPDDATGVAANSSDVSGTQTMMATFSPQITKTNDLGLITNTPFATVTFTIIFEPTTVPTTRAQGTIVPPIGTVQPTPIPTLGPTPISGCMASSTSIQGATIRRTPETNGDIVDNLGGYTLPVFTTMNGWYELMSPNINLPGWVWVGDVQLVGADCDSIPLPTPTIAVTFGSCTAVTVTNIALRPDPFMAAPATAHIASGNTVEVLTVSDNNWYLVRAADSSTGWTPINTVTLTGNCSGLAVTSGYVQAETATAQAATPTPSP